MREVRQYYSDNDLDNAITALEDLLKYHEQAAELHRQSKRDEDSTHVKIGLLFVELGRVKEHSDDQTLLEWGIKSLEAGATQCAVDGSKKRKDIEDMVRRAKKILWLKELSESKERQTNALQEIKKQMSSLKYAQIVRRVKLDERIDTKSILT